MSLSLSSPLIAGKTSAPTLEVALGIGLAVLPVLMRSFQQLQKYCVLADEVSWVEVSHQRCVLSAGEKGRCQEDCFVQKLFLKQQIE